MGEQRAAVFEKFERKRRRLMNRVNHHRKYEVYKEKKKKKLRAKTEARQPSEVIKRLQKIRMGEVSKTVYMDGENMRPSKEFQHRMSRMTETPKMMATVVEIHPHRHHRKMKNKKRLKGRKKRELQFLKSLKGKEE